MLYPLCCAEQGQDGLSQVRGVDQELRETEQRGNEVALQHLHPGAGRAAGLSEHFPPKTSSCLDTSALVQYAIPPLWFFSPLLKMGREGGMCKGPVANVLWESLHVSSLCRGASHKVLYFLLPRAPGGTDLLTTFKGEGCLPFFPALNRRPLLQPAHSHLPHRQLQGPNPKQDSDEPPTEGRMPMRPPKTRRFAHTSPKGGDHHCRATASSIAQLRSFYLSPFP